MLNVCDHQCYGSTVLRLPLMDGVCLLIISFLQTIGMPASVSGCPCRKQDDEQGRLIDQVTSETSGVVEGLRMKHQSMKHKESQAQQLRGQVLFVSFHKLDCSSLSGLTCFQNCISRMIDVNAMLLLNTACDELAAWLISTAACYWPMNNKCCM